MCSSKDKQVAHYLEMHANKHSSLFEKDKHVCIVCGARFRTNEGLEHHSDKEHQKALI